MRAGQGFKGLEGPLKGSGPRRPYAGLEVAQYF